MLLSVCYINFNVEFVEFSEEKMLRKRLLYIACAIAVLLSAFSTGISAFATEANISYDKVAPEEEQAAVNKVGKYGMLPIYGRDVKDGTYAIEVESSSTMFNIIACELTVKDGEMTADITLNGQGYLVLYPGTAEEASKAAESDFIGFSENADGKYVYTFPVEALDKALDCAAFSKDRQQWYNRSILFDASTLPEEALLLELPDYAAIEAAMNSQNGSANNIGNQNDSNTNTDTANNTQISEGDQALSADTLEPVEPMSINMEDGEYAIEVELFGGSGKASVVSPTILTVEDGKAYARIQWSSSNYDYMIVGKEKYLNRAAEGADSVFEIPIAVMDADMPVIADTTAMGAPREIGYTLLFYSDTIGSKAQMPQESAKRVVILAVIIIVGGGILNHFAHNRKRTS